MKKVKRVVVVLLAFLVLILPVQVFAAPVSPEYTTPAAVSHGSFNGQSVVLAVTTPAAQDIADMTAYTAANYPDSAPIGDFEIARPEGHHDGQEITIVLDLPGLLEGASLSVVHKLTNGGFEVLPCTIYPAQNQLSFVTITPLTNSRQVFYGERKRRLFPGGAEDGA